MNLHRLLKQKILHQDGSTSSIPPSSASSNSITYITRMTIMVVLEPYAVINKNLRMKNEFDKMLDAVISQLGVEN